MTEAAIIAALMRGDLAAAEAGCQALAATPDGTGPASYLLGLVRHRQNRIDDALDLLARGAAIAPHRLDIAFNYGVILREAGRLEAAIGEWTRVLALAPDHRDSAFNRARAYTDLGDDEAAADSYRTLLSVRPGDNDGLANLGNCLYRLGRFDEAVAVFTELSGIEGAARGPTNLGMALAAQGRRDAAEAAYRHAIAREPGAAAAHYNLAMLLLEDRRWDEGLAEFEWRLAQPQPGSIRPDLPLWRGDAPPGTRILVWNDQGMGDAIQFLRHVRPLAERGLLVTVLVQTPLVGLAATIPGVERAVGPHDPLPAADVQAPLLSLPLLLGAVDLERSWPGAPYIGAGRVRPTGPVRRVGLVWAGNPDHANDANRSVALDDLAPLLAARGIEWVGLQKGAAAAQGSQGPWAGRIRDRSADLTDFTATAEIMAGLDLVISVDTAPAHLAGAMGVPVWVLLPETGLDWRWPRTGAITGLYPSMRLYRAVRAMAEDLAR